MTLYGKRVVHPRHGSGRVVQAGASATAVLVAFDKLPRGRAKVVRRADLELES